MRGDFGSGDVESGRGPVNGPLGFVASGLASKAALRAHETEEITAVLRDIQVAISRRPGAELLARALARRWMVFTRLLNAGRSQHTQFQDNSTINVGLSNTNC
jgi:hypothetical protein